MISDASEINDESVHEAFEVIHKLRMQEVEFSPLPIFDEVVIPHVSAKFPQNKIHEFVRTKDTMGP
jgi:hypothetical protein